MSCLDHGYSACLRPIHTQAETTVSGSAAEHDADPLHVEMQSLAVEWGARGVNVNSISPGIVETDLIKESKELQPLVEGWISRIPAGCLCHVDDLKAGMVFLTSRGSDYLMGHNLVIDGGQNLL